MLKAMKSIYFGDRMNHAKTLNVQLSHDIHKFQVDLVEGNVYYYIGFTYFSINFKL